MLYSILGRLFPRNASRRQPSRIVMIRPCCIGDAVMATAALSALREAFPQAHISWAVGAWSARAIEHHPAIDSLLDCGDTPLNSPASMLRLIRLLRAGNYDLAVSLVRSPLMSLAVYLSGIPFRAGLDSSGRGFGYNLRVAIDPSAREHESAIYLKVVSAIAGRDVHAYANLPVTDDARKSVLKRLRDANIPQQFIAAHPGGGGNPGMTLDDKRYPPVQLADILNQVSKQTGASVILLGGPGDTALVDDLLKRLTVDACDWSGAISFQQIGALAAEALLYIGNDSGLTHLAAASGARAVMMMGPTDPLRYAPFTQDHLVLWKPVELNTGGAVTASDSGWDWPRDGFSVDEGVEQILEFLAN